MNGSKVGCRRQQRDKHSKPSQQQIKSGTLQQYTPTHTVTGCPARGRACTAAATHMQGSTVKADAVCKRVRTLTAWPLAAALAAAAAAVVPPRLLLAAPLLIVGVVPGGSRVEEVREPPQRTDARGNRHGYSAGLAVERQVEVYKNHGIWGDNRGAEEGVCRGHASQPPIQRRAVGSERPERLRAQQRNRRRPRKGDRRRIVMWGGSAPFAWRKPAAEQPAHHARQRCLAPSAAHQQTEQNDPRQQTHRFLSFLCLRFFSRRSSSLPLASPPSPASRARLRSARSASLACRTGNRFRHA